MWLRLPMAMVGAALVTLGLFLAMYRLIGGGQPPLRQAADHLRIDFVRVPKSIETHRKVRHLPKPPPLPQRPPPPPPELPPLEQAKVAMPRFQVSRSQPRLGTVTGKPWLGVKGLSRPGPGTLDQELTPLVKIAPRYPRRAAMLGKEGWVKVAFTVTPQGTVEDVKVLESQPPRLFDRAAKQAILKWKFKPKTVDGKAVASRAVQKIEFKLHK